MTVQDDLRTAQKIFIARLDDATATFQRDNRPENIAAATAYMSQQLILLTDLCAALSVAVVAVADRLDASDRAT